MRSFVLLLLAAGCGRDPSGIWLLEMATDDTSACVTSVEENFGSASYPGGEGGDWTSTRDHAATDSLVFAQIQTSTYNDAVLVMGGKAYPGTWANGTWEFSWNDQEAVEDRDDHTSGYTYAEYWQTRDDQTLIWNPDGANRAEGETDATVVDIIAWEESDTWNDDVADTVGWTGQMPSDQWLVEDGDDWGGATPQRNYGDEVECSGSTCQLIVTEACQISGTFTATRTDYVDEAAFQGVDGVGQ